MTLFLFLKGKAAVGRKCFVLKGSESGQLFIISLHLFITFRVLPARIHFIFFSLYFTFKPQFSLTPLHPLPLFEMVVTALTCAVPGLYASRQQRNG